MKNTIFYGNGLNRLNDNSISWLDILTSLMTEEHSGEFEYPNTFAYEKIFMSLLTHKTDKVEELELKNKIATQMESLKSDGIYNELLNLDAENFITTNYDYSLHNTFKSNFEYKTRNASESLYSVRRHHYYRADATDKRIWNIHGEIGSVKSIMIGLDHYCGSIGKIDAYVKGKYTLTRNKSEVRIPSIGEKIEKNIHDHYISWIDLMFFSNVYILGFGLDYSETDLWWILNKRARMINDGKIKINNNIYFYDSVTDEKKELLESFHVTVIAKDNEDHKAFFNRAIKDIRTKIDDHRQ